MILRPLVLLSACACATALRSGSQQCAAGPDGELQCEAREPPVKAKGTIEIMKETAAKIEERAGTLNVRTAKVQTQPAPEEPAPEEPTAATPQPVAQPEVENVVEHPPKYFGQGVPEHLLPKYVTEWDFDPRDKESALFKAAGIDLLDEIYTERRARMGSFTPEARGERRFWKDKAELGLKEGDLAPVYATIKKAIGAHLEGAERYHGMRQLRASIIGAGDLKGIPMDAFEDFEEVVVADVNLQEAMRVVQEQMQTHPKVAGRVTYHREDVTGLIGSFRWKVEYLMGVVEDPQAALQIIVDYIKGEHFYPKHFKHDTPQNSTLRYAAASDVIILNEILGELGYGFEESMWREIDRVRQQGQGMVPMATYSHMLKILLPAAATLHTKVQERFVNLLKAKMEKNPNRKLVLNISPRASFSYELDADGNRIEASKRPSGRRSLPDSAPLAMFKGFGRLVFKEEATAVTLRYRIIDEDDMPTDKVFIEEETFMITAYQIGEKDLSFEEYIQRLKSGEGVGMFG